MVDEIIEDEIILEEDLIVEEEVVEEVLEAPEAPSEEELAAIEAKRLEDERIALEAKQEDERQIELDRQADLKARYAALSDGNAPFHQLGISNPDLYFNQQILFLPNKLHGEERMKDVEAMDRTLKLAREADAYKESRRLAYPSMVDQLDKIYHEGLDAWKADIKAIKDKYPKPEGI